MAIGVVVGAPGGPVQLLSRGQLEARGQAETAYSGSVWGAPIPISQGFRKITGVPLWGGVIKKDNVRTVTTYPPPPEAVPGGLAPMSPDKLPVYVSWELKRSFAVGFGYRLNPAGAAPKVRRIWADGSLIYSNGVGQPLNFKGLIQDYLPTGQYVNGVWVPNPNAQNINLADNGPFPSFVDTSSLTYGNVPQVGLQSKLQWRFHDGSDGQLPDQEMIVQQGNLAMSFPFMMYIVFDDLIVGKGYSSTTGGQLDYESINATPDLPTITVELEDGDASFSVDHSFTYVAGSPTFGANTMSVNWTTREIALISPYDASDNPATDGGFLHIYNIDSATETSFVRIPGTSTGDSVGNYGEGFPWDTVSDVFYTRSSNSPFVSITKAGAVISRSFLPRFAPGNVDNSSNPVDWTAAKPCTQWPPDPDKMELAHALQGGTIYPVLCFGTLGCFAMLGPSLNGVIPNSLLGTAAIDPAAHSLSLRCSGIQAFPLFQKAVDNRVVSQDVAFLTTWSRNVVDSYNAAVAIVFAKAVSLGDGTSAVVITGIQVIKQLAGTAGSITGFLDGNGDVIIQEEGTDVPARFSKWRVNYVNAATNSVSVPGFQGIFPKVAAAPDQVVLNDIGGLSFAMFSVKNIINSDLRSQTMILPSNKLLDLNTGLQTANTGFTASNASNAWDSVNGVYLYSGTTGARQMRWEQLVSGVNGVMDTMDNVVKNIAKYRTVGFTDAQLQVNIQTPHVPGVLITKPYDLTTLFNSLGALYNFTYFNSGGKLVFTNASLNPLKATGSWTIDTIPLDGDTATIGTFVYRFKTVPIAPFDVKIEQNTSVTQVDGRERTLQNFFAAILANIGYAASTNGFFPGTVKNDKVDPKVTAQTTSYGVLIIGLTATSGGVAGNAIATTKTGTSFHFGGTTLAGGSDPPTPSITVNLSQLAFVSEQQISQNDAIVTEIDPAGQSQTSAQVNYYALEQDYILANQKFIPDNQNGTIDLNAQASVTYDTPLVISSSDAYARVAKSAFTTADGVTAQYFRLPQAFMTIAPADIVQINVRQFTYLVQMDEATLNGDFSVSFGAKNYSYRTDVTFSDADAQGGIPQNVGMASDAYPLVMDATTRTPEEIPNTSNIQLYTGVRAYRAGFSLASFSGGLSPATTFLYNTSLDTRWGTVTGLPVAVEPYYRTVEDSMTVVCQTLTSSDFAPATDYPSFVAGQNCIAVGFGSSWEYIYFRDVTVLSPKTVLLKGLIRAQRGSDQYVDHSDTRNVAVLVASASSSFNLQLDYTVFWPLSTVGSTYRYSSLGQPASRGALVEDDTLKGNALYPWAPCQLKAALAAGNDLNLSWKRRDRRATKGTWVTSPPVMSETSERYDLEILNGTTVVRTLTDLTTPSYTYTSANQTTDGFAPPLTSLSYRVYQKGQLGRGFPRKETVNVN